MDFLTDPPVIHEEKHLILPSSSFRRQELLTWLGIPFKSVTSDFPEEQIPFEEFDDPEDFVKTIALGKVLVVEKQYPHSLIIGSDTTVVLDGKNYGKPKDLDDARRMLVELRGRTHAVYTAVVMHDGETGEKRVESVVTKVTFFSFSDQTLEKYIATSESLGKAGGYGFQGEGRQLVERIEGSATNCVGLPLLVVRDMLEDLGVQIEVNVEQSIMEKLGYSS